jgi:hypothetical protein
MSRKSMSSTAVGTIGIDLGKNSFHLVGLDQRGAIVLQLKCSRAQLERRLANVAAEDRPLFFGRRRKRRRGLRGKQRLRRPGGFRARIRCHAGIPPLAGLAHDEEPRGSGGEAGRGRRMGQKETAMNGKNRIMIYGLKTDGTYVVEFKTAAGEALAISIPRTETAVIRHFQGRMPHGLFVPDVSVRTFGAPIEFFLRRAV